MTTSASAPHTSNESDLLQLIANRLQEQADRQGPTADMSHAEAAELVQFLSFLESLARTQRYILATCEELHLRLEELEHSTPNPQRSARLQELSRQLSQLAPGRELESHLPPSNPPPGGRRPLGTIP